MNDDDLNRVREQFGLPELPEPDEETESGTATLVIFRFNQENIPLLSGVPIHEAQEYASRDDTRDPDGNWFVGYWRD